MKYGKDYHRDHRTETPAMTTPISRSDDRTWGCGSAIRVTAEPETRTGPAETDGPCGAAASGREPDCKPYKLAAMCKGADGGAAVGPQDRHP